MTLAEARKLSAEILDQHQGQRESSDLARRAYALAEVVDSLDHWLSQGGFQPYAWDVKIGRV